MVDIIYADTVMFKISLKESREIFLFYQKDKIENLPADVDMSVPRS